MTKRSSKQKKQEQYPTLGIKAFQAELEADDSLQYHDIIGERLIEKPHKHNFFIFQLFEKGSGTHTIDFVDYKVKDSQIHLLFPDQVHTWKLGKRTVAYQLMISRRVYESFSSSLDLSYVLYQKHPVVNLASEMFNKLLYEILAIKKELQQKPIQWRIVNLRSRLIAEMVSREAEKKFKDMDIYRTKPMLHRYNSLVDAHFREQKSVSFYASQLNITPNYLNILSQRHFHVPAMFLIQNRITLEAKRLLQASDKSIKEISFELGFNDPAYFSNFFKAQTDLSPREFREQL